MDLLTALKASDRARETIDGRKAASILEVEKNFKAKVDTLTNLGDVHLQSLIQQLKFLSVYEVDKVAEFSEDSEFWEHYTKLGFAQLAAFAASIVLSANRTSDRKQQMLDYLGKFAEIFKR